MLSIATALVLASVAWAATDNLTVTTRTGTFTGNLNDTYPDVRQFKYIPYAKVRIPTYPYPEFEYIPLASRRRSTLDLARSSRQLNRSYRLYRLWSSLPTIRLRRPYRMGTQHHRKPRRQLRGKSTRRPSRPKLGRGLSYHCHLDPS